MVESVYNETKLVRGTNLRICKNCRTFQRVSIGISEILLGQLVDADLQLANYKGCRSSIKDCYYRS